MFKWAEDSKRPQILLYLVKSLLSLSHSASFKLTMGGGLGAQKSIIEIYAYRLLIGSFLEGD